MLLWDLDGWQWLALFQHELLLFAGVFFLIGAIDDLAIDFAWVWLKLTGRASVERFDRADLEATPLEGDAAVFVPAWQEAAVIGDTVRHMLAAWPQHGLRLYVGCYRNDAATVSAIMEAANGDRRLRIVIHDRDGPSTKADCLNRLYRALCADERRTGRMARMVLLHDAEDMVDPAALALLDKAIGQSDFVQLPVEPVVQQGSRWLGSHYCEEFAEAHGKAMVVRDALGAALPAAGVGCAMARTALEDLRLKRGSDEPFSPDSLTEDYELGFGVAACGGTSRFLRARDLEGRLIATRAYFPSQLDQVVRQKTRWVHGIALQGWDRVGWSGKPVEAWMRARDRRGPLTALLLLTAYFLLALLAIGWIAAQFGLADPMPLSPVLEVLLWANLCAFVWRALSRFAFTMRIYGMMEGVRAVARIPLTNVVAIMAGRRAVFAYARTLMGKRIEWDKTPHFLHPTRTSLHSEVAV